ncbi:signal transduction histidine kinase [Antricoccus suffuscus]|uniref:histidine kinase n=1 Tax=Antricoccus suffuscus TaxID=1629062 RepID=A0A2T0ZYW4_9ACTN|nr:histidine kinase [Antricoccus suffuscus]PRZ41549.1 signal transduction histidine kinase [Antricoccus suffuscus]
MTHPHRSQATYRLLSLGVVIAVAIQVALTAFGQLSATPAISTTALVLDIVVGVAGCAAMPFVVRLLRVPMYLVAALSMVAPTGTPPAAVTVVIAGRTQPFRVALGITVTSFVAHLLRWIWFPITALPFGWWVVIDFAANAALLGWGANGRWRAEVLASYRERAHRAETDGARRVAEAQSLERSRITREIHDVLGHRLSLVATYAGALEFRPDASPEQVAQAAAVVRAGLHQALEELREVIRVANDESSSWRPQPTLADIDQLVAEARNAGDDIASRITVATGAPTGLGRTAYRIVQEALTNARKHASGEPVEVVVEGGPESGLEVTVRNPLPPRPDTTPPGVGLIGLAERVGLAGGTFRHGIGTDGNFELQASLPWPGEQTVANTDR